MRSFTNDVTTAANARPMTNATAIWTKLPFRMKSMKPFTAPPGRYHRLQVSDPRRVTVSARMHDEGQR